MIEMCMCTPERRTPICKDCFPAKKISDNEMKLEEVSKIGDIVASAAKEVDRKIHEMLIKHEALSVEGGLNEGFTLRRVRTAISFNSKDTYILEKNGKQIDYLRVIMHWN